MGCDIHAYVDYEVEKDHDCRWVKNLGSFRVERDYLLFGIMAGVRHEQAKLFDPKGLPDRMSYVTNDEVKLFVVEDEREAAEGRCHRRNADRWHENHEEEKKERGELAGIGGYVDAEKTHVYHPDWHSHSWLTADELRQVIEKYNSLKPASWMVPAEIVAICNAMRSLEESGYEARLVFWFDN